MQCPEGSLDSLLFGLELAPEKTQKVNMTAAGTAHVGCLRALLRVKKKKIKKSIN